MTLIEIIIQRIVGMNTVRSLVGRNPSLSGDDQLAIRDGMLHADDPYPGIVVDLASQEHERDLQDRGGLIHAVIEVRTISFSKPGAWALRTAIAYDGGEPNDPGRTSGLDGFKNIAEHAVWGCGLVSRRLSISNHPTAKIGHLDRGIRLQRRLSGAVIVAKFSSLGTKLQLSIASVLTDVAGVRDVEFESPEMEMYEADDLAADHVEEDPSGRTKGGSCKASMFYDPAAAGSSALIALFNAPVKTSGVYVPTDWAIVWSVNPAATQPFKGTLVKQNVKAERGSPLIKDLEIKISRKPVLV